MTNLRSSSQLYSQYQSFAGSDYRFMFYVPVPFNEEQIRKIIVVIDAELKSVDTNNPVSNTVNPQQSLIDKENQKNSLIEYKKLLQKYSNNQVPMVIDSIQTLSFQIHTDIQPVRSLKFKYPRGYCVGQRLIAGSIIATVFNEHPFMDVMELNNVLRYLQSKTLVNTSENYRYLDVLKGVDESSSVVDEIPPMNILMQGVNEQGDAVESTLYGVKLINDGTVISAQDMITEQTFSFVAQDIDLFRNKARGSRNNSSSLLNYRTGTSLLNDDFAVAQRRLKRGIAI